MAPRQIHDVQIVAHPRAIGRVVIVAEHPQEGLAPHRHLGDEGKEVVGQITRTLADLAAGVRPDGVEIAQRDGAEGGVGRTDVAQHLFHHQLGAAVGIGGRQRMRLGERQIARFAIHRGR
ncbi:hypothetical protein D3C72_2097620 [compost metagenome]